MVREAINFMAKSSNRFRRPASQVGNRGFESPFRQEYKATRPSRWCTLFILTVAKIERSHLDMAYIY